MVIVMKKLSFSSKLFLSIIALFLAFASCFLLYQARREKAFKIALLNRQLQDYNTALGDALQSMPLQEDSLAQYLRRHPLPALRLTIIDPRGYVLYDNCSKDYPYLSDHRDRKEIREALQDGSGYDLDRVSRTVEQEYFYSATYIPAQELIIRAALPYDDTLPKALKADSSFLWFAALLVLVLVVVLFRFTRKTSALLQQMQDRENLEMQRELTQNISHELKTPLSGIRAYLETLHEHPELPEETRRQFIDRSWALTRRITDLMEDLGTLDAAQRPIRRERLDLREIIGQVQEDSLGAFKEKQMLWECSLPETMPMTGDAKLLYGLFRNLTDNALRYAGEGSTVTLQAKKEGTFWQFSFADNGPGVPEDSLPHLYDRFFRTDKGRSREMGGTGLGLSIVREAVRLHGGTIRADNVPPHGLRHSFTLSA